MNIVLNIGHGGKGSNYDSGAIGYDGTQEHLFNKNELYPLLKMELESLGYSVTQVIQEKTFSELPLKINNLDPDLILSLHFNAYDGSAHGTEILYYTHSKRSKALADILQRRIVSCLGLTDRGVKPLTSGRGSALLKLTMSPCVILEPFFGDNKNDLDTARAKIETLAKEIALSVKEWKSL